MDFFKDERDWFFKKRFGLFVHFGLYSIEGFHEQEQFRKGIPRKEYEKYASVFNPEKFDPYVWIETAKKCGMEYMVFTAKHQDGFCMWNTKTTDYNIINTPYGRDLLKELSDACHSEKFPLIIYYCITDNHHPNYPNRGKWHELPRPEDGDRPDRDKYLDYLKRQVIELCSDYGKIHGFFWDANHLDYRDESINWIIRDIQPAAVINGRGFDSGDYNTPEREFNEAEISSVRSFTKPTEACQSFGIHSWGYRKDEDFYSTKYLIRSIDRILSMGGNYLLNIAPDASGQLDSRAVKKAEEIGKWFAKAKESYDGAVPVSDAIKNSGIYLTVKGNSLYVHLNSDPIADSVELIPLDTLPEKVTLINDGRTLSCVRNQGTKHWTAESEFVRIKSLPTDSMSDTVMILKMDYKHLPARIKELSDSWKLTLPDQVIQKDDK